MTCIPVTCTQSQGPNEHMNTRGLFGGEGLKVLQGVYIGFLRGKKINRKYMHNRARGFIRWAHRVRGSEAGKSTMVVYVLESWRSSSCSAQEAANCRTRAVTHAAPVQGGRPEVPGESALGA